MTPFVAAVVAILKKEPNYGVDAYRLREALMAQGFGKHPAAVAMNLTRIAWREEYFTSYCLDQGRIFYLTEKGKAANG